MSDSYVCSGSTMRCTMGTSQARLTVLPTRTAFLTGKPQANISDHQSFVNLGAFGRCRSMGFPATASATAANHGTLTPMPCMHNTPFPWMGGKNDYIVKGDPALLKSSTCSCMWGGIISIVDDGQSNTGAADMSKVALEQFEQITQDNNYNGITGGAANVSNEEPSLTPQKFLENALKYKGSLYSMQKRTGPDSFDCSGLIQVAAGMPTWTTSDAKTILNHFEMIDSNSNKAALRNPKEMNAFISRLQPGDILVWDKIYGNKCSKTGTGHVVIYTGKPDGMTFEARSRKGVNYYNDLKMYWLVDDDYGYPTVYRVKS